MLRSVVRRVSVKGLSRRIHDYVPHWKSDATLSDITTWEVERLHKKLGFDYLSKTSALPVYPVHGIVYETRAFISLVVTRGGEKN